MELQKVKDLINMVGFSEEAKKEMNEILDGAIQRGGLTLDEKQKLLKLVDLEIEKSNLEIDTLEEIALALEGYVTDVLGTTEMAAREAEVIQSDFEKELEKLKKKVKE
jgi:intein-encoded DNA endonuclease-like protein